MKKITFTLTATLFVIVSFAGKILTFNNKVCSLSKIKRLSKNISTISYLTLLLIFFTSCNNSTNIKTFNDVYISDNIIFAKNEMGNNNFYKIEIKGLLKKDTIKTPLIDSDSLIITQEKSGRFLFQSKYDNSLVFQLDSKQIASLNQTVINIMFDNAKENLRIKREEEERREEEKRREEHECQNFYNELAFYFKNYGYGYATDETCFYRKDIYGNRLNIPAIYFNDINSIFIGTFNWANGEGKTVSFRVEANGQTIEIARPGENRNQNITEKAAISLQSYLKCKFNKIIQIRYGRI